MANEIILPGINGRPRGGKSVGGQIVAKPVLVCDLDGTLRYNKYDPDDFINEADEIALYEGVIEAAWIYRREGWLPTVVTNQGGVAHGHMTIADWDRQRQRMDVLAVEEDPQNRGDPFLDWLPCFYDERSDDEMYGLRSFHRKPQIGALASIGARARSNGIVPIWDESVVIGDREEDRELAENGGLDFWDAEEWRDEIQTQLLGGDNDG